MRKRWQRQSTRRCTGIAGKLKCKSLRLVKSGRLASEFSGGRTYIWQSS